MRLWARAAPLVVTVVSALPVAPGCSPEVAGQLLVPQIVAGGICQLLVHAHGLRQWMLAPHDVADICEYLINVF